MAKPPATRNSGSPTPSASLIQALPSTVPLRRGRAARPRPARLRPARPLPQLRRVRRRAPGPPCRRARRTPHRRRPDHLAARLCRPGGRRVAALMRLRPHAGGARIARPRVARPPGRVGQLSCFPAARDPFDEGFSPPRGQTVISGEESCPQVRTETESGDTRYG